MDYEKGMMWLIVFAVIVWTVFAIQGAISFAHGGC